MATHAIRHFDVLSYVDRSKALGLDEGLAKYQARQMEELLEMATDNARSAIEAKELATKKDLLEAKGDLKLDIQKSKLELVMWVAGMFIASGLIQHFFK